MEDIPDQSQASQQQEISLEDTKESGTKDISIPIQTKYDHPKNIVKSANDALVYQPIETEVSEYAKRCDEFFRSATFQISRTRSDEILQKIVQTKSTNVLIAIIDRESSPEIDVIGKPSPDDPLVRIIKVDDTTLQAIKQYGAYIGKATITGRGIYDGWEFVWYGQTLSIVKRNWFWNMLFSIHKMLNNVIS
jgi:hypothetical protein